MARNGFYWHSRCSHSHRICSHSHRKIFIYFFGAIQFGSDFSFHFEYYTLVIQRQFRTACSKRQTRSKCTLNAVAAFFYFIESTKISRNDVNITRSNWSGMENTKDLEHSKLSRFLFDLEQKPNKNRMHFIFFYKFRRSRKF